MKRLNVLAVALAASAAPALLVLSAKADLAQLNEGQPVVTIKSNGGQITVRPGEPDGLVRVPGNPQGVRMNRFYVGPQAGHITLPPIGGGGVRPCGGFKPGHGLNPPCGAGAHQQPPHINFPLREGPRGVAIENPGGDLAVGVPTRFDGMLINAGASPVLMERTRGPFVIVGNNDVALHGVTGYGWVRTTAGNVDVRNPTAGGLRLETQTGRITLLSGPTLDRAELHSMNGDIEWTIAGVGGGPYRIVAGTGTVTLFVRPGVGANIDAESLGGTVTNTLDPAAAEVRLERPHAVSLAVGGGGAQITVQSQSGSVVIAPAP